MKKKNTDNSFKNADKLANFKARCKEIGLKVTPQRTLIYTELSNTKTHPTADTLYRHVKKIYPNISLDTVNRTLLTFAEKGLAFIVEGTGQPKRYDADCEHHQHFICIKCKRIIDFSHKPFENIQLPEDIESKFKILRKTVYVEGICDRCSENTKN